MVTLAMKSKTLSKTKLNTIFVFTHKFSCLLPETKHNDRVVSLQNTSLRLVGQQ